MINHQHAERRLGSFQLQPELFPQRLEKCRSWVQWRICIGWLDRIRLRGPLHIVIDPAVKSGLIDNSAVQMPEPGKGFRELVHGGIA
jgi:hypothetical protein